MQNMTTISGNELKFDFVYFNPELIFCLENFLSQSICDLRPLHVTTS